MGDILKKEFKDWKKLLDNVLQIGKRLLENGAEIHRVEETINYILLAYGADMADVFAIPNLIIATVESKDEYYTTKIKRIKDTNLDLYKVELLNKMSRDICSNLPSIDEIDLMIKEFDNLKCPKYPILRYLGALIGCFGFSICYGGSYRDAIAAAITALIMGIYMFSNINTINKLVKTLILSIIGGFVSVLLCKIHIGQHVSYVMIGAIMMVIPGMAISTAMKDVLMDDLLSGSLRLLQSILIALVIVIGFSVSMVIFKNNVSYINNTPMYLKIICGGIGSLGFGLVFNNNYKHLIILFIGSILVYTLFLIFYEKLGISIFLSTTISAMCSTCFAETLARLLKTPASGILTTINLPLVPGGILYYSIQSFWSRNKDMGIKYLLDTFYVALGIGAGIIIIMFIIKVISNIKKEIKNKNVVD